MNNKELEKKQEKQKKALNIVKWCGVGLLGGLLAFGFFGLLALGVRGCANKQQAQQQESAKVYTPKALKPSKQIDYYVNGNSVDVYYDYPSLWAFLGGSTDNVRQSYTYKWTYDNYEASGQQINFSYYPFCFVSSSQFLGTCTIEGLNLDKTLQIRAFGLYNEGFYFSSINVPNNMNNTNTIYCNVQDMESGYIDSIVFTTYDIFTPQYLHGNSITINYYQYNNGNFNYTAEQFIQTYFELQRNAPTYINGNNGLEGSFSLIYQAFASLGSILSLQVVGGITLGTLVFIPLVVGLIIFIVHLFKR